MLRLQLKKLSHPKLVLIVVIKEKNCCQKELITVRNVGYNRDVANPQVMLNYARGLEQTSLDEEASATTIEREADWISSLTKERKE